MKSPFQIRRVIAMPSLVCLVLLSLSTVGSAEESAGTLCTLSGEAGSIETCPLQIVAADLNQPVATAVQITLSYPPSVSLTQLSDGEICFDATCFPYTIPVPNSTIQSGHSVITSPSALSNWDGNGEFLIFHSGNPDLALTNAYLDAGAISGDPTLFTIHFTLVETVLESSPVQITLNGIVASESNGKPLKAEISNNPAVISLSGLSDSCDENGEACDDGDSCTFSDSCIANICYGHPLNCDDGNDCTSESCDVDLGCTYTVAEGPCEDGNPCTVETTCFSGNCIGGLPLDCDDGDGCTIDTCKTTLGCTHKEDKCDDNNVCTTDDCAKEMGCIHTPPLEGTCTDPNPCTQDICDPQEGCMHLFITGGPCNDGNECTTVEFCEAGVCAGDLLPPCEDNNPCTNDYCDPAAGCIFVPNINNCNDGEPCTNDDRCNDGSCVGGAEPDCDDDNDCTADACSAGLGCVHQPTKTGNCNDGLACNGTEQDVCNSGSCVGPPCTCTIDADCPDEGDKCNGVPYCHPFKKICENGTDVVCSTQGDTPCLVNQCEPTLGICAPVLIENNTLCNDGDNCTIDDACLDGVCAAQPSECDDENLCTLDACDPVFGTCVYFHLSGDICNDDDPCTAADACLAGLCVGLLDEDCSDGDDCTDDLCDSIGGCFYTQNQLPCEDGEPCTADDLCNEGVCLSGGPDSCDDDDLCSVDFCDPVEGCYHELLDCNDGDLCNGEETCHPDLGCQEADPPICVDTDPCTQDDCDPELGCTFYDICGPGPFFGGITPTASEGNVVRILVVTGKNFTEETIVAMEGGELVDMEWISETEIHAELITPADAGIYDVSVVEGLWHDSHVDSFTILNPPPPPPGAVHFTSPFNNAAFLSSLTGIPIPVTVDIEDVTLEENGIHLRYLLDGVMQNATIETNYTFPQVPPGMHELTAQLVFVDGSPLGSTAWRDTITVKIGTPCNNDSNCFSGPCTNLNCLAGSCVYGNTYTGCCTTDETCPPGAVCVDGICGQCNTDADCVEGNTCTVDTCVDNICQHATIAGCCEEDIDCDDANPCTIDICDTVEGECSYDPVEDTGCCVTHEECNDGLTCTIDFCIAYECRYGPNHALQNCCDSDDDCGEFSCIGNQCVECSAALNPGCDDGDPCTVGYCDLLDSACITVPIPDCCVGDEDCDDGSNCTEDDCNLATQTCLYEIPEEDEGCCEHEDDCDDGITCNIDRCLGGFCRHGPNSAFPDCCTPGAPGLSYLKCTDNNPCTNDICFDGVCVVTPSPDKECCYAALECDDGTPYTLNKCIKGECVYVPDPTYCEESQDCIHENICKAGLCINNKCAFIDVDGCCASNFNCYDGNPCTQDTCDPLLNTCFSTQLEDCCESTEECPTSSPCSVPICIGGTCHYLPTPGCCETDAQCSDDNDCTDDLCVNNLCSYSAAPGCLCQTDIDCADGDICTVDSCENSLCSYTVKTNCCANESQCDDGNPCTNDVCIFGTCKGLAIEGCCEFNADCIDSDPCTIDVCTDGFCTHIPTAICAEPTGILHGFGPGLEAEGFATESIPDSLAGWIAVDGHAVLDLGTGPFQDWEAILFSPLVNAAGAESVFLQWDQTIPNAAGTPGDIAEVRLSIDGGASWDVIYNHNVAGPAAPPHVSIDISATAAGQPDIQVAFAWIGEPASGGADWKIDSVVIGYGHPPVFINEQNLPSLAPPDLLTTASISATDEDPGDILFFTVVDPPEFVALQSILAEPPLFTTTVLLTPAFVNQGNYSIDIIVTDPQNLKAVVPFGFTVD